MFVLWLQVTEIFNFTQDDLMTEDLFILDCHSDIYVWVGQQLDPKIRLQALSIAEVWNAFLSTFVFYLLQHKNVTVQKVLCFVCLSSFFYF